MSILVGICGGSGSGKSTLAQLLAGKLGEDRASLLAFDTYYRDHGHLTPAQRADVNYDHPDSLDLDLFVEHLDALAGDAAIEVPVYDFATHTRTAHTTRLEPREITVVEGILLFAFPDIADRLALRVYRSCPEEVRFARRVERDVAERGRTSESVRKQFEATVKPMHDKFVKPSMACADLVVSGHGDLDDAADQVLEAITAGRLRSLPPRLR